MPNERKIRCPKGHSYAQENTTWGKTEDGKPYQQCKACRNARHRLRYKTDPVWAERRRQRVRAWRAKQ